MSNFEGDRSHDDDSDRQLVQATPAALGDVEGPWSED